MRTRELVIALTIVAIAHVQAQRDVKVFVMAGQSNMVGPGPNTTNADYEAAIPGLDLPSSSIWISGAYAFTIAICESGNSLDIS